MNEIRDCYVNCLEDNALISAGAFRAPLPFSLRIALHAIYTSGVLGCPRPEVLVLRTDFSMKAMPDDVASHEFLPLRISCSVELAPIRCQTYSSVRASRLRQASNPLAQDCCQSRVCHSQG